MPEGPASLLIVDDEEPIRTALARYLTQHGYEVTTAASGTEALAVLGRQKISAMLLDVRMPGTSGIDLVPQALEIEPNLAILMLTAVTDATTAALCMQRGAFEYLIKPIDLVDLGRAVERALRRRATLMETAQVNQWLKEEVAIRAAEVRRERATLERVTIATLEVLVNALEAKDPFSRGHSARVADLSAMIAADLGMSDEEVEVIRTAGRLHDIGKIGIREEVLGKQGPLTPAEYEHVKDHVIIGTQILAPLAHLHAAITCMRSHHERWDGQGYPDGLKGEEIPFGARIIAIAEIFDALTTSRPYQEKMPANFAVDRLRDLVGTAVDPGVFAGLESVIARRQTLVFLEDTDPA
jgi:putative nucleotidyltransferase with HDIG domain